MTKADQEEPVLQESTGIQALNTWRLCAECFVTFGGSRKRKSGMGMWRGGDP
jgi:hypothetical protein